LIRKIDLGPVALIPYLAFMAMEYMTGIKLKMNNIAHFAMISH
jgi:hypothetical protein